MRLTFEYHPLKSDQNRVQHGVDFEQAQQLWEIPHIFFPAKDVGGETRTIIGAHIGGRLYIAVFTRRGESIRLISCHKADRRWQIQYERRLHEKKER